MSQAATTDYAPKKSTPLRHRGSETHAYRYGAIPRRRGFPNPPAYFDRSGHAGSW